MRDKIRMVPKKTWGLILLLFLVAVFIFIAELAVPIQSYEKFNTLYLNGLETTLVQMNEENRANGAPPLQKEEVGKTFTNFYAVQKADVRKQFPARVSILEMDQKKTGGIYFFDSGYQLNKQNSIIEGDALHELLKDAEASETRLVKDEYGHMVLLSFRVVDLGERVYGICIQMPVKNMFHPADILRLCFMLLLFAIVILGGRALYYKFYGKLKEKENTLIHILDSLGVAVVVQELDTNKILYINQTARTALGEQFQVSNICYETYGFTEKCPWCPETESYMNDLRATSTVGCLYYNPSTAQWIKRYDSLSPWITDAEKVAKVSVFTDVTEQKVLETRLYQWTAVIKSSPDIVAMVDVDKKIITINDTGYKMLGLAEGACVGDELSIFYNKSQIEAVYRDFDKVKESDEALVSVVYVVDTNGMEWNVQQTMYRILDNDGHIIGVAIVMRDISELVETKHQRAFQIKKQEFISDMSAVMMSTDSFHQKFEYLMRSVYEFFDSKNIYLARVDTQSREWVLENEYSTNCVFPVVGLGVRQALSVNYEALLEEPYIVADKFDLLMKLTDDPHFYDDRCFCLIGIRLHGELYGAFSFDISKQQKETFNTYNDLLNTLQAIVIFIIQNKTITDDLERGNQRMDSIFNASTALIFYTDNEGVIQDTNGRFLVTQESVGLSIFDIDKNEAMWDLFNSYYRKVFDEKVASYFHAEDANQNYYFVNLYPLLNVQNEVVGISNFVLDITEERKRDEKLAISQKGMTAMLKSMPVSLWILDNEFDLVLLEGTVITSDVLDIKNKPDDDLFKQKVFRTLLGWPSTFVYDLDSVYLNNYISPYTDEEGNVNGVIGVSIDVTDLKAMEIKVSSLNSRLNMAIDASKAAIWEIIPTFNKVICNTNTYQLLGMDPTKSQITIPQFMKGMLESRTYDDLLAHINDDINSFESKLIWSDGTIHYATNYIRGVSDNANNNLKIYGISIDNTAQSLMAQQIIEERDRAEIANQAKSEFLSKMSHEIRTPMNAIIGMTSLAKRSKNPERLGSYLDNIQTSSEHLLNVINDILDMSKIESGKLQLFEQEFGIETVIRGVMNIMALKTNEKNQTLNVEIDPSMPFKFYGDDVRLAQVLLNLLSNANKFTPINGTISVKVTLEHESEESAVVKFNIKDTGIGLNKDKLESVFEPFEQADGTITRKFGGTGLGLAICKKIVEMMGGQISVDSEIGKGSSFTFTVVLKQAPEAATPPVNIKFEDLRILAIDDSKEILDYMTAVLANSELVCECESRKATAVEKVKQAILEGRPYNVIFLDYIMPDVEGLELVEQICELTGQKCIIVMISMYNMDDVRETARQKGVFRFIEKPLFPSSIIQVVKDLTQGELSQSDQPYQGEYGVYDFSGKHIILAEDMQINAEIVKEFLSPTNVGIDFAADGQEAYALYKGNPGKYDLILMDVQMPICDGYEATEKLRKSGLPGADRIPVVAMTANVFKEDVDKEVESGMNGHISKPINEEQMLKTLNIYLSNKNTIIGVDEMEIQRTEPTVTAETTSAPTSATYSLGDILEMEFEGIDLQDGLKRMNKNFKLYSRLLKSFVDGAYKDEFVKHLEAGDKKEAAIMAHTIKGTSANLSLKMISHSAAEVETMLKLDALDMASTEFQSFLHCYDLTCQSIASLLSKNITV